MRTAVVQLIAERSNNSFKPKLFRYIKHMAGTACHVFASATQFGLTQALGVARVIPQCYHPHMKVAISLPDPVFSAAEKLAHRLRVSRSQLYAQAIEEYLGKRQDSQITERLNALYAAGQEPVDPAMTAAQLGAIGHEAW